MSEKRDFKTKPEQAQEACLVVATAPVLLPYVPHGAVVAGSSSEALLHARGLELPSHPGVPLSPPGVVPESDVRTHAPGAAAAQQRTSPLLDEELGDLPRGYGDGRLVCLVRDPTTLFVYWDLSQAQLDQAFGGLGAAKAALKLLTLRGELVRELEIQLDTRSWYIHKLPRSAELRVELWALGETGSRLLRASRPLRLPAAAPSMDLSADYALVPADAPLPKALSPGKPRTFSLALGTAWLVRQELLELEGQGLGSRRSAGEAQPQSEQAGAAWTGNRSGEGR